MSFLGDPVDLLVRQTFIALIEFVVKFPEFFLLVGGKGGHSRLHGHFMAGKRVIHRDHFDRLRVLIQHLLDERAYPRTVGSLEIAENDDGYGRVLRSLKG